MGDLLGAAPSQELHRLFFALLPGLALRSEIAGAASGLERVHRSGGRLLQPERYHLTLNFLGDFQPLPPSLVAAARAAGDTATTIHGSAGRGKPRNWKYMQAWP